MFDALLCRLTLSYSPMNSRLRSTAHILFVSSLLLSLLLLLLLFVVFLLLVVFLLFVVVELVHKLECGSSSDNYITLHYITWHINRVLK